MNIKQWADAVLAFPAWLVVNLVNRWLPVTHRWHKKWFTLMDWTTRRTNLQRQFDVVWWLGIAIEIHWIILLLKD